MTAYAYLCGGHDGRPWLALADDGTLWKHPARAGAQQPGPAAASTPQSGSSPAQQLSTASAPQPGTAHTPPLASPHWEPVLFNKTYAGYYAPCHFTALAATKNDFVAAGLDPDGRPCVYRSLYGGVWDQVSLLGGNPVSGWVQPRGRINAILYDRPTGQLFLLSSSGEVVTLPDCPKCVRIRQVCDQSIITGELCGVKLCLRLEDGSLLRVSMADALQLRISYSYARKCLAKASGGAVIWLGHQPPDFEKIVGTPDFERNTCVPPIKTALGNSQLKVIAMDNLKEWLDGQPKDMFMAFWCDYGTQADEAAACARKLGYESAFSMGGIRPGLHVD